VRASLVETLRGEPASLLPEATPATAAASDDVELETARVRVLRAGGSDEQWIVEPVEPCSLLAADRELLLELGLALQAAASRLAERHGAVRIEAPRVAAGVPLRWRVSPAAR
jgi:O-acetyl-ADP-ribose deacetylase (regulator of RNase III)